MLIFPQLASGAIAQFPIRRTRRFRVAAVETMGGERSARLDTSRQDLEWTLQLEDLSSQEFGRIQRLFQDAYGRLRTFLFLDPCGNLLSHSEDLHAASWTLGPLTQIATGLPDPFMGTAAQMITNASQSDAPVSQIIQAPANLNYCLSVYLKGVDDTQVTLFASDGGVTAQSQETVTTDWRRFVLPVSLGSGGQTCTFGLRVEAGARVTCFGFQVDAQPFPSPYKKSTTYGGVFAATRFATDSLACSCTAPGLFSATVSLVSHIA
jgi:hypothetical protein